MMDQSMIGTELRQALIFKILISESASTLSKSAMGPALPDESVVLGDCFLEGRIVDIALL